ncbi:hypothetical protein [Rhizobium sp. BK176]|uniref:hypothetical protein n=1 Tax=Rhizobium sp. BK176 TaxID=2587071 RepID=UPI002166D37B|nr:hypothetical protein [Rhizobium sp. BK176]MCS4089298.1 hypothetical protein [Rhizobium sp. BK176]
MNKVSPLLLAAAAALLPSTSYSASDCDFDKPIGSCTATIDLLSSGGSRPSFSAEISINSSASSCSKVEYFLDSTPQTTILRAGSSGQESLFGTTPITKDTIKVERCTAYENQANGSSEDAQSVKVAKALAGRWVSKRSGDDDYDTWYDIRITVNEGDVVGTGTRFHRERHVPRGKVYQTNDTAGVKGTIENGQIKMQMILPDGNGQIQVWTINGGKLTNGGLVFTRK